MYGHLFSPDTLDDLDLGDVTEKDLRIPRESAALAALNRVEMSEEISDIGPAWFFPTTARVVFDLDADDAERIDALYRGGFFNEYRRLTTVKAHAALGGRFVHGCQSSPNMSGGAVVPYGVDLTRFRTDLGAFKRDWIDRILALTGPVPAACPCPPADRPETVPRLTGRSRPARCGEPLGETLMDALSPLLADLAELAHLGSPVARVHVRAWALSGVERVRFAGDREMIFKWAREPFTAEADVLRHVRGQGVPVPVVFASVVRGGRLGVLMEDLGDADREATMADAATAAVTVHEAKPADALPVLDRVALTALPGQAIAGLEELRAAGRWTESTDLDEPLARLADHADRLADGVELAPFGLCHSEFHPTSLHVRDDGWHLLDWARSFIGPGLLDLASWQGTQQPADSASLRRLIWAYIRAGGAAEASRSRAGLPAERWALGWHRLWIIAWYLEQATTWMPSFDQDTFTATVIRRHLHEAGTFLWTPS
ncbi:putative aminoglycoside phosphotransferase [Frankia torreyi]|uniref:Putative aminoglycoside phosphotransferase n=1 Tax=Frankia torreyi TaxID=1856 RepID=A0A0D8BB16_9ACTN|nr:MULTISPECIES: phosphotransferase [Frankia]KJE21371.1 putative aminoglycoside phosphotransferase [Frankia torreyi]KQM03454.1 putative aminoglycoside phosphotransferase [Frankia sp. CpI1-P]